MRKLQFNVGDNVYHIGLNMYDELYFTAEIPYERTVDYEDDGQWGTWWEDDWDDSPSFSTVNKSADVNIFEFIRELKGAVVKLIRGSGVSFFYFVPNSDQKTVMYTRIYQQLISEFSDWDVQIYDKYFYFYKKEERY